jgi:hypothetical protein
MMNEVNAVSAHDTNDPEQILKNPVHEILRRLREDANKLASLGAIDQEVLRRLVGSNKTPESERDEKLQEALHCVEAIVKDAYQARHALDEVVRGR